MGAPAAGPQQHADAWPTCRPHPAYVGLGLLLVAAALIYVGTRTQDTMSAIGTVVGVVVCLGIAGPARVHRRAHVPLPGQRGDGQLVLITEGPAVRRLMARVRDPDGELHRDISFTYLLVAGVVLPVAALLVAGSISGYEDLVTGLLLGLGAGFVLTVAWRPLHASWWALRTRGTVLDPKSVAPILAAHAEAHGEHTVYAGVAPQGIQATLAAYPELAVRAATVASHLGAERSGGPG